MKKRVSLSKDRWGFFVEGEDFVAVVLESKDPPQFYCDYAGLELEFDFDKMWVRIA